MPCSSPEGSFQCKSQFLRQTEREREKRKTDNWTWASNPFIRGLLKYDVRGREE